LSKYYPFENYLKKSQKQKETLMYEEIENILGFALPKSAHDHRQWWENGGGHTQANSWLNAGWKVEDVYLGKHVTFIKI